MSIQPKIKDIEEAATYIISDFIEARNGVKFIDINEVIMFIIDICSKAAILKHGNYENLELGDKVNIITYLFPNVYIKLHAWKLIYLAVDLEIQRLLRDMIKLKFTLRTLINNM